MLACLREPKILKPHPLTVGEGSTMGKRPRFNLKGTVTVTRQRHHQQAKHASPTLRHWVRLERRREAGPTCRGGCPAPEGPLP